MPRQVDNQFVLTGLHAESLRPPVEIIDGAHEIAVNVDLRFARPHVETRRTGVVVLVTVVGIGPTVVAAVGVPATAVPSGTVPAKGEPAVPAAIPPAIPARVERSVVRRIIPAHRIVRTRDVHQSLDRGIAPWHGALGFGFVRLDCRGCYQQGHAEKTFPKHRDLREGKCSRVVQQLKCQPGREKTLCIQRFLKFRRATVVYSGRQRTVPQETACTCASASTSGAPKSKASPSTTTGPSSCDTAYRARATATSERSSAIRTVVQHLETALGATGTVGVGIPGTISPATGLVKNSNSTWMNGRPLADDLPRLLGRPVLFANDANCFALSEATDGAGAGARVVFGVILGTGTGGGIVANGQVLEVRTRLPESGGTIRCPPHATPSGRGHAAIAARTGCIELFLSGPGLARDYAAAGGGEASAAEIAARAATGDAVAEACLARYEDRLARALSGVINVLDPDVIVLGGGLSNVDRLLTSVPKIWRSHIFSDAVATRLVRAVHGDSSGVRGAAWLHHTTSNS